MAKNQKSLETKKNKEKIFNDLAEACEETWDDLSFVQSKGAEQKRNLIFELITYIIKYVQDFYLEATVTNKNDDEIRDFIFTELLMMHQNKKINNELLEIYGLTVSSINQHSLINKFKKYYKNKNIILRTNRLVETNVITIIGQIRIERYVLRPKTKTDLKKLIEDTYGCSTIIPFDEFIGLKKFKFRITPLGMIKISNWAAQLLSYKSAAIALKDLMNVNISQETVRNVCDAVGQIIYNNDILLANETHELYQCCKIKSFTNDINHVLYIETDGAMIHLHHDQNEIDKLKKENNKNLNKKDEKDFKTGWHENKLGLIFSSDNMVEKKVKKSNSHKSSITDDDDKDETVQYTLLKREYVSYIGTEETFQKLLFHSAIKNGYGRYNTTVLLSDGATWIKNMKNIYFCDAIHILDFYHLCEHIYDFAKKYYNDNPSKYVPWAKKAKKCFIKSQYEVLMPEIKKMQTKMPLNTFNFYNYIINNKDSIDYDNYIKKNLYIGSGHIESGNKSILQERLKRPGMTWNKQNAQNLLTLRTKFKSETWSKEVTEIFLKYCYSNDVLPCNLSAMCNVII